MNLPIYLEINLSTKKVRRFKIDAEMFRYYIGGKTLAAKLLYDLTPAGIDPLSEEAMIIINTGPANGTGSAVFQQVQYDVQECDDRRHRILQLRREFWNDAQKGRV